MANPLTAGLLTILVGFLCVYVEARPSRVIRQAVATASIPDNERRTVSTPYGGLEGISYPIKDDLSLDVFLGIPYAQPPVGDLRLAAPEPIQPWSQTRDSTRHGAKCVQRLITADPVLENVPFGEDCLFVDIYVPVSRTQSNHYPTMIYIHPGGFYGGTGAKYNFTNLAVKGVAVAVISFRNDVFGYLSTMDDVIPGNFALLDQLMAIDFIKEIIPSFGGDPNDITLFGASSGAACIGILSISPLATGKFQKAIMQSGSSLSRWAVYNPETEVYNQRRLAWELALSLSCDVPDSYEAPDTSSRILSCFRSLPVETLRQGSIDLQFNNYNGAFIFLPVAGDKFGILPRMPEQMLVSNRRDLPNVDTIIGFTSQDGSWLVPDPDNDGVTLQEIQWIVRNRILQTYYRPSDLDTIYNEVMATYLPPNPDAANPLEIRDVFVRLATDAFFVSPAVKQARLYQRMDKSGQTNHYVYEFNHRPSYSTDFPWMGVGHSDEKGYVLGLPEGPDPFKYPDHDDDDERVAELVTTMWTNFAKHGDPTPSAVDDVIWPEFEARPEKQDVLVIRPRLSVKEFDRNEAVVVWTRDDGFPVSSGSRAALSVVSCVLAMSVTFLLRWV